MHLVVRHRLDDLETDGSYNNSLEKVRHRLDDLETDSGT